MLEEGILRPELIHLGSLQKIVEEGLKSFPDLEFPLEITRYHLLDIIKLLQVEKVGHLHYLMIIPLTYKEKYQVFKLIPHPIHIDPHTLGLPDLKEILLIDGNRTYISTTSDNLFSISNKYHVIIKMEAIFSQNKSSCEWEAFQQNGDKMVQLCNYKKVGNTNDTLVLETPTHRLVYFDIITQVSLECPGKNIRTQLQGMHRFPLSCDVKTELVYWPAKQTLKIEINETEPLQIDSTMLPIINLNKTSKLHTSLKNLIEELPKENEPYTVDFDYYGITNGQIQSYQIYANSILIVIVIINSLIIGFLFVKWYRTLSSTGLRRAFQSKKLKRARDSLKQRYYINKIRNNLRKNRTRIKNQFRDASDDPLPPPEYTETGSNAEAKPSTGQPIPKKDIYPILPRYL